MGHNRTSPTTRRARHRALGLAATLLLALAAFASLASATAVNTWQPAPDLSAPRQLHTATMLLSGKVLVAGGSGATDLRSAELYDPVSNNWSSAGDMSGARERHTATLLNDGRVLVVGGAVKGTILRTAELYDPATNTWTPAGALPIGEQRENATATLLPSGKVLVAGGNNATGPLKSSVLYDPASNTWALTGDMRSARNFATATLLPSGQVLAVGGYDGTTDDMSAELYDPASGTWSLTPDMTTARELHTATLLPSGKVLVVGGSNTMNATLSSVELYDPASNTWSAAANLPSARSLHTATLLPSGKVLIAAGSDGPSYLNSAEVYDPASNRWTATPDMAGARIVHTATLLGNGKVLVAGGTSGTAISSAELYVSEAPPDPPTGVAAVAGDRQATVSFTAPADTGGLPLTSFTVTSSRGQSLTLPASGQAERVAGLTNGLGYTFTVTATNAFGTSAPSATSNAVAPAAPAITPRVSVSRLSVSPHSFRAASSGATVTAKQRKQRPTGSTVRYADTHAAKTTFTVLKPIRGFRRGSRCVTRRPKTKAAAKRRCTLYRSAGSFAHFDKAGTNRFHFTGRVRRHKLPPGRYLLRAVPRFAGRGGAARTASFRIIR